MVTDFWVSVSQVFASITHLPSWTCWVRGFSLSASEVSSCQVFTGVVYQVGHFTYTKSEYHFLTLVFLSGLNMITMCTVQTQTSTLHVRKEISVSKGKIKVTAFAMKAIGTVNEYIQSFSIWALFGSAPSTLSPLPFFSLLCPWNRVLDGCQQVCAFWRREKWLVCGGNWTPDRPARGLVTVFHEGLKCFVHIVFVFRCSLHAVKSRVRNGLPTKCFVV
jgi:hypothetical protein